MEVNAEVCPKVPGVVTGVEGTLSDTGCGNLFDSAELSLQSRSLGGVTSVQEGFDGYMALRCASSSASERWKEREQQSARVLVSPGVYSGNKVKGRWRRSWVKVCNKYAGAFPVVVEPFDAHAQALVLSVATAMWGC